MNERQVSVGRAILTGHLVITVPTLVLLVGGGLLGYALSGGATRGAEVGALLGVVPAWLWWSLAVPRWRVWAVDRGADAAQLQRIGMLTGLVWPKGWVFEKTEIPPRKGSE